MNDSSSRTGPRRRAVLQSAPALVALLAGAPGRAATDDPWAALRSGAIVLLRHADAPGGGDPPGFRIDDCSTQRNLSDAGRAQARRIGEQFRARGVAIGAVLSSQWCRTRETAELAFPGLARDEPAFNSNFSDRAGAPAQTAAALALLLRWAGPGVLVVCTHQGNINALTGRATASGEGVVVRPAPGGLVVLASIQP
jgi:phosphohistidine phosphatase SixA